MKRILTLPIVLASLATTLAAQDIASSKLTGDDSAPQNAFGFDVAIDGDYAIVGAFLDNNAQGDKAGAAYIFRRDGLTWIQEAKLVGSDVDAGDRLGFRVGIAGIYAIAATASDNDDGAAYVFVRDATSWTQQAKLTPQGSPPGERFGSSVAMDGDRAVVGGFTSSTGIGSLYVFQRNQTVWTQQARLVPDDLAEQDGFGQIVGFSGGQIIAGSPFHAGVAEASGAAYVFGEENDTWTQEAKLVADDLGAGHWFGVGISVDGDYAVIGSAHSNTSLSSPGAVYVFKRGVNAWTEQAKLISSDIADQPFDGGSVAIAGTYIAVGAPGQSINGSQSGAVYVFTLEQDVWVEQAKLIPEDNNADDNFGLAVELDGVHLIGGADGDHFTPGSEPGKAYIYALSSIVPTAVESVPAGPGFALSIPYPNPTGSHATLIVVAHRTGHVRVDAFDLLGRRVSRIFDGTVAGGTTIPLTMEVSGLPSGVYAIRAVSELRTVVRPLLVHR